MVTIQHRGLHNRIAYGVEQAKALSRSILVSQSMKLNTVHIDPITFYERGINQVGNRVFWSAPNGGHIMVGIGKAYTFKCEGSNNFEQLDQEWKHMLDHSMIEPSKRRSGVGPVLLGAFSFDPIKVKTKLWSQFPTVKMLLPRHLLTIIDNEVWLSLNVIVHPDTDSDELADRLFKEQSDLIHDAHFSYKGTLGQAFTSIDEIAKEEWLTNVDKVAREIRNNPIEKVVLAREIRVESESSFRAEDVLYRLRNEQPTSYIYALESGNDCFIGASPERLVKKEGNQAFTTCLAGSIARGDTEVQDDLLGNELLMDEKNIHEHEVVVRAIKSSFEQSCDEVEVPDEPILYKVRDIQHLYTPVVGKVKKGVSLLTLVEKLHPTPALGGYPREEALQIIRDLEKLDRGFYAGPIGWLDSEGNGDFAVAIRSGLLKGKQASLFAGCGIMGDSDPVSEYKETEMKLRPMLSALGGSYNEIK